MLGLQACSVTPGFIMISEVQTHVLMLAQQACYLGVLAQAVPLTDTGVPALALESGQRVSL